MNCLSCGKESTGFLCEKCRTVDKLDELLSNLLYYSKEYCDNQYLNEYADTLKDTRQVVEILPQILQDFPDEIADFYYCKYYRATRNEKYEKCSLEYLDKHSIGEQKSQLILYDLINYYIPDDFAKPEKWCRLVADTKNLGCELYAIAAKYFGMIGDYDLSENMIAESYKACNNNAFLFSNEENVKQGLATQTEDTNRYRTKKAYWPMKEQRRLSLVPFYDARGIKYGRITKKPEKIAESNFAPIKECDEDQLDNYCAFWCLDVFSAANAKCICQIAAAKVRNGVVVDTFESYVKPWDCIKSAKEASAKELGISVSDLNDADDVDIVMKKFFAFVDNDTLVSTDALGKQLQLVKRATRYAGISAIDNPFFDLLDMAAKKSRKFDLNNNTREFLLKHFSIKEGKTALEKALRNKDLYDSLEKYGE